MPDVLITDAVQRRAYSNGEQATSAVALLPSDIVGFSIIVHKDSLADYDTVGDGQVLWRQVELSFDGGNTWIPYGGGGSTGFGRRSQNGTIDQFSTLTVAGIQPEIGGIQRQVRLTVDFFQPTSAFSIDIDLWT